MKRTIASLCLALLAQPVFADKAFTDAMNTYRAEKGRSAIVYSDKLASAAQSHANDMVKRKFFSHTGSNGSSVGKRVRRAGYKWCYVSENIAADYSSFDRVFKAWKGSPGHAKNMLNRKSRQFGIGKGAGGVWVMVLANPC